MRKDAVRAMVRCRLGSRRHGGRCWSTLLSKRLLAHKRTVVHSTMPFMPRVDYVVKCNTSKICGTVKGAASRGKVLSSS